MTVRTHNLRPTAKSERYLQLGAGLAVIAIIAIVAFLLIRERSSAEQVASCAAANIVQLIDTDVQRNAELYDQALLGMIETTQVSEFRQLPKSLQHRLLFDRAITAPLRGDLLWVDPHGRIIADSMAEPPRKADFTEWHNFQEHKAGDRGLLISHPFQDRIGTLGWCISFSRRISSATGEFAGVATGALRLSYFDDLFKRLNIGKGGTISLISDQGILLARQPTQGVEMIGMDLLKRPNFQRMLTEGNGSFTATSSLDKSQRLYTFSRVGELPLMVVVALSTDSVFAAWQRTALLVGSATGILCIGILWLSLLLGRELRLRQGAERDLAQLAATDSLTGLANRRAMDQVLHMEWARAQRSGAAISVLMIDVDHFRAFNERHGHHGGDQALRSVAAAIEHSIRRPGDLAARYGGEEFLVILAETDLNGALIIAETIRHAVENLPTLPDAQRPITVSIGVSAQRPKPGGNTLEAMLGKADAALYQAKHNGRNQVAFSET